MPQGSLERHEIRGNPGIPPEMHQGKLQETAKEKTETTITDKTTIQIQTEMIEVLFNFRNKYIL